MRRVALLISSNEDEDDLGPITLVSGDQPITSKGIYLVDATGGNVTLTLNPAATFSSGCILVVKIDSSGNSVIVDGSGAEQVNGAATQSLALQYQSMMIVSNKSTAWFGSKFGGVNSGWSVSNVSSDKSFDADNTSLNEQADVMGTLVQYLLSRGDLAA